MLIETQVIFKGKMLCLQKHMLFCRETLLLKENPVCLVSSPFIQTGICVPQQFPPGHSVGSRFPAGDSNLDTWSWLAQIPFISWPKSSEALYAAILTGCIIVFTEYTTCLLCRILSNFIPVYTIQQQQQYLYTREIKIELFAKIIRTFGYLSLICT